jgi:PPIC-type PPIASE domain
MFLLLKMTSSLECKGGKLINPMKTYVIVFFLLMTGIRVLAQSRAEAIAAVEKIQHVQEIEKLKVEHPTWPVFERVFWSADSVAHPEMLAAPIGEMIVEPKKPTYDQCVYKVLEEREIELCRVQYIYLKGTEYSTEKIDSLRKVILKKYRRGVSFDELVKEYNMDGNVSGDLGWYHHGMMVKEFEDATMNAKKGEIFTVDVPGNKWYYVVLKTHDNRKERAKVAVMVRYRY